MALVNCGLPQSTFLTLHRLLGAPLDGLAVEAPPFILLN
jgi:hypothetical protein